MISDSILAAFDDLKDSYRIKAEITYFKESGKYYASAEIMVDYKPMFEIKAEIAAMNPAPGLTTRWYGPTYIVVPDHIHNHPMLINT